MAWTWDSEDVDGQFTVPFVFWSGIGRHLKHLCVCVCVCVFAVLLDVMTSLFSQGSTPPLAEIEGICAKQTGHRSVLQYLWETKIHFSEYSLHIFRRCFTYISTPRWTKPAAVVKTHTDILDVSSPNQTTSLVFVLSPSCYNSDLFIHLFYLRFSYRSQCNG